MILYSAWLKLPINTRHEIARIFKIPKTGATEVVSNDVVKDGYSVHDLEAGLTKEALQAYLGSIQDNYEHLWEDMVSVVQNGHPVTRATYTAATEEEPITSTEEVSEVEMGVAPSLPTTSAGATMTIPTPPAVPPPAPEPSTELTGNGEAPPPLPTLEEQKKQKTRRIPKPRDHGKKA